MFKISRSTTAVVAAAAAIAAGCGDDEDPEPAATPPPAEETNERVDAAEPPPAAGDQLDQVLDDPAALEGQQVTITGEVTGATSAPSAFQVIRPRGAKPGIAVLPTEAVTDVRSVVSGKTVTVTGTLMKVTPDLADQGKFLFETDNASNTVDRIESEYVIAAESVDVS